MIHYNYQFFDRDTCLLSCLIRFAKITTQRFWDVWDTPLKPFNWQIFQIHRFSKKSQIFEFNLQQYFKKSKLRYFLKSFVAVWSGVSQQVIRPKACRCESRILLFCKHYGPKVCGIKNSESIVTVYLISSNYFISLYVWISFIFIVVAILFLIHVL